MSVFYDTRAMTLEEKTQILNEAKAASYQWWVDELDCKKSYSRITIEMSYEDILGKLDSRCHFVIVYRSDEEGYEFGFSTMYPDDPDLFLWIYVEPVKGAELVKKLKIRRI